MKVELDDVRTQLEHTSKTRVSSYTLFFNLLCGIVKNNNKHRHHHHSYIIIMTRFSE